MTIEALHAYDVRCMCVCVSVRESHLEALVRDDVSEQLKDLCAVLADVALLR